MKLSLFYYKIRKGNKNMQMNLYMFDIKHPKDVRYLNYISQADFQKLTGCKASLFTAVRNSISREGYEKVKFRGDVGKYLPFNYYKNNGKIFTALATINLFPGSFKDLCWKTVAFHEDPPKVKTSGKTSLKKLIEHIKFQYGTKIKIDNKFKDCIDIEIPATLGKEGITIANQIKTIISLRYKDLCIPYATSLSDRYSMRVGVAS